MTKLVSIVFALNLFACATDPQTGGGNGTCGDNKCDADETEKTCPADCTPVVMCGNKTCDAGESTASCPGDCPETCGNGTCGASETSDSCAMDCAAQFKIIDSTTLTISSVYAWACGSSNTYVSDLTGILPPGYYVDGVTISSVNTANKYTKTVADPQALPCPTVASGMTPSCILVPPKNDGVPPSTIFGATSVVGQMCVVHTSLGAATALMDAATAPTGFWLLDVGDGQYVTVEVGIDP